MESGLFPGPGSTGDDVIHSHDHLCCLTSRDQGLLLGPQTFLNKALITVTDIFSIESTSPVSTLIPASPFDCSSISKSWMSSFASKPAFWAMVTGSCLRALA